MKSNISIILFCFFFYILPSINGQTVVDINPNNKERTFEGIGALSAGASFCLLIDYPESISGQILDLLFKPKFGELSFNFDKGCIYTLSTTKGQQKGDEKLQIPQPQPFTLPCSGDFESYDIHQLPKFTQNQAEAFDVQFMDDNKGLKQMASSKGIEWLFHLTPEAFTFLGDTLWPDYEKIIDVMIIGGNQSASGYARINRVSQLTLKPPQSYWLKVDGNGVWKLGKTEELLLRGYIGLFKKWPLAKLIFSNHTQNPMILSYTELKALDNSVLDSHPNVQELFENDSNPQTLNMILKFNGKFCLLRENILKKEITVIDMNKWTNLKLAYKGNRIVAYIANRQLGEIIDCKYSNSYAVFGCGWHEAWFDNLKVKS